MYRNTQHKANARSMRTNPTEAERELWRALRCKQLRGHKFRRQTAIGKYLVDFVCFDLKLVVEVDGGQHNDSAVQEYDKNRTAWLESQGFRVVRYWNHDVIEDVDAVVEAIWLVMEELSRGQHPSPSPSQSRGGG